MQTTIIYEPKCSLELCGFEAPPTCPVSYGEAPVWLSQPDGTNIYWTRADEDGIIGRFEPNGCVTIWYRKPTIADAVAYKGSGGYFKFNSNGSVEARWYEQNYFWQPDNFQENEYIPNGKVEVAHKCQGLYRFCSECPGAPHCDNICEFCEEEKWQEEEIPCHACGADVRGWDLEEKGFCDLNCWKQYHGDY